MWANINIFYTASRKGTSQWSGYRQSIKESILIIYDIFNLLFKLKKITVQGYFDQVWRVESSIEGRGWWQTLLNSLKNSFFCVLSCLCWQMPNYWTSYFFGKPTESFCLGADLLLQEGEKTLLSNKQKEIALVLIAKLDRDRWQSPTQSSWNLLFQVLIFNVPRNFLFLSFLFFW